MPVLTHTRARALRHVLSFECIGSACEATCCQGWRVPLDSADESRLIGAAGPELAAEWTTHDKLGSRMRLKRDRSCTALDDDHLCGIQKVLGAASLPSTCATYPRLIRQSGAGINLGGALSCPEMVRKALEHPMEAVEVDYLLSPTTVTAPPPNYSDPWAQIAEPAREVAFQILDQPDRSTAQRLFGFTWLAQLLDGIRRDGGEPSDALYLLEHPQDPRELDDWLEVMPEGTLGTNLAKTLVFARLEHSHAPSFARIAQGALHTYAPGAGAAALTPEGQPLDRLAAAYRERRDRIEASEPDIVDRISRTLVMSELFWQPLSPNTTWLQHSRRHLARHVLFRFLLFGHPDVDRGRPFEEIAVEVTWSLARSYDHAHGFLARLDGLLEGEAFGDMLRLWELARF